MLQGEPNPRIDGVKFQLRVTGVRTEQPNPLRSGIHTRGYLPHVKREGARYFVTFRLEDALPKAVFIKIKAERERELAAFYVQQSESKRLVISGPDPSTLEQINREYFRKLEHYLDHSCGECWLGKPEIAELVSKALQFFDG